MPQGLPLPVGSYQLPDPKASCRRLVNCFVQAAPQTPLLGSNPTDTKQTTPPVTLMRAAGITSFANNGTSNPCRGMWMMQGVLYAVIGPTLYSVSSSGALSQIGSGIPGSSFVRMVDNGACLTVLVPNSSVAFTYSTGGGFQQLTAPGFTSLGAIDLGYIDSFTVFVQQNGQGFFNDDGKAVSGTGQITFNSGAQFLREFGTDPFVGMGIAHRAVTILGQGTGETYIDAGNAVGSPFSAAPDGFIQLGCALQGGYTIAIQDQALHFLANDLTIRRLTGQTPTRVSNHGIESVINTANLAGLLAGAYALTFTYLGHLFYAVTLPAAGRTLVLDVTTGEFHELSSIGTSNGQWRVLCAINAYGKQLVGDSLSGQIGYLDTTASTEFGTTQAMSWTHQAVYSNNQRISHRRLELLIGAGQATSYTATPFVSLQVSDDGGNTFRAFPMKSLGQLGAYKQRIIWTNLGIGRQRVYQFTVSAPLVSSWVVDCLLDAAAGRF